MFQTHVDWKTYDFQITTISGTNRTSLATQQIEFDARCQKLHSSSLPRSSSTRIRFPNGNDLKFHPISQSFNGIIRGMTRDPFDRRAASFVRGDFEWKASFYYVWRWTVCSVLVHWSPPSSAGPRAACRLLPHGGVVFTPLHPCCQVKWRPSWQISLHSSPWSKSELHQIVAVCLVNFIRGNWNHLHVLCDNNYQRDMKRFWVV